MLINIVRIEHIKNIATLIKLPLFKFKYLLLLSCITNKII